DGRQRAYQYSFRIKPAYRGAGLGTRMLFTAEEDLRRKGFNQITLMVAQENLQAQRLYQRLGYRVVACESGCWWYPDQDEVWQQVHEPGWRMEKLL
ncbi:MAG: GNAT family N-acetyltransferase, partial [Anaerolineaceae bacterium]|nr:GNAT family N-acetyltransferase [Anaerolineaceae bacterium]